MEELNVCAYCGDLTKNTAKECDLKGDVILCDDCLHKYDDKTGFCSIDCCVSGCCDESC